MKTEANFADELKYYNPLIITQNKQPSLQKNSMDRIFMFSSLDA